MVPVNNGRWNQMEAVKEKETFPLAWRAQVDVQNLFWVEGQRACRMFLPDV